MRRNYKRKKTIFSKRFFFYKRNISFFLLCRCFSNEQEEAKASMNIFVEGSRVGSAKEKSGDRKMMLLMITKKQTESFGETVFF
jgi:hypothetical protein